MKKILLLVLTIFTANIIQAQCNAYFDNIYTNIDCINNNNINIQGNIKLDNNNCSSSFDYSSQFQSPYYISINTNKGATTVINNRSLFTGSVSQTIKHFNISINFSEITFVDQTDKINNIQITITSLLLDKTATSSTINLNQEMLQNQHDQIIDGPLYIDINEPAKLSFTASPNLTYTWSVTPEATYINNNNTNELIASWDQPWGKKVTLNISNGNCEANYSRVVNVKPVTLGFNDEQFSKISFANPVKNQELVLSKTVENITITNLNGSTLVTAKNTDKISLTLVSGLYLINLDGKTQKLIVE